MNQDAFKKAFGSCDFGYKEEKKPEMDITRAGLENLLDDCMGWMTDDFPGWSEGQDQDYMSALARVKRLQYTKENIPLFCERLRKGRKMRAITLLQFMQLAGLYISAAVNLKIEKGDEMELKPRFAFDNIGYMHSKGTLIINGNVGDYAGDHMRGGRLIIKGNADSYLGYCMKGGRITVEGSAGSYAANRVTRGRVIIQKNAGNGIGAYSKKGCKIIVSGDAGDKAGYDMDGATLTIEGSAGDQLAYSMKRGAVTVEGNAGDYACGYLEGGKVIIEGNAGDNLAYSMRSGTVTVKGNAGGDACAQLAGGKVVVNGTILGMGIGKKKGAGKIWRNGKRIW